MHSVRRVALRAASAAAVAVLKPQAAHYAARFATASTAKAVAVPAARFFGSSAIHRNEEPQRSAEDTSDVDAVKDAMSSATEAGSTAPEEPPSSSELSSESNTPPVADEETDGFIQEPNGVYGVFIWNIPYRSTEREMFDTFSRFGKVHSLNIGRDARGLSRGFAFIYYQSLADAKAAVIQADGAFWQGRRIGAKPKAKTDGSSTRQGAQASPKPKSAPTSSLYVGNIPYEATDAELNQLFSGLENVLDVRVAIDKATGWPRGFAHADFADVDSAARAMEKLSIVSIQGRQLRVDYSESKRSTNTFVAANDQPGPNDKVL